MLLLRDVVKHYPGSTEVVRAVDGVSLSVERGEMVALYGPSASGKTTVLMLAAGLLAPDAGTITVDGTDVTALRGREEARFRREVVGVVFQSPHLMAGATAAENAALKLLADPISFTEGRRRARPILKRVGLDRQRDRLPAQLSGGERQRVGLARALANHPSLLLADEPTGNLDTQKSREIFELLRSIAHERRIAILLVTHDKQAAEVADRSLRLCDGKLTDPAPPPLHGDAAPIPAIEA